MKIVNTQMIIAAGLLCLLLGSPTAAFAYEIKYNSDKTEAKIFCDNGYLAGTFNWNGTQWSNGVNWGLDIDALARKQVAIAGTACK